MNNESIVKEYYDGWAEKVRLTRDKAGNIEYVITTDFINRHLTGDEKILELGCGAGIYSLAYASEGYDVTAIDISEKYLDILRESVTDEMTIQAINMNATNLDGLEDDSFDVSLVLGPLYHLFDEDEINMVTSEVKRVTKPGGIVYVAFLSKDYITVRNCFEVFDESERYFDTEYKFINSIEEVFYYFYVDEIEKLMNFHGIEKLHFLTTDGISRFVNQDINELTDKGYQRYLDYLKCNCERKELMGFSPHLLYVGRI